MYYCSTLYGTVPFVPEKLANKYVLYSAARRYFPATEVYLRRYVITVHLVPSRQFKSTLAQINEERRYTFSYQAPSIISCCEWHSSFYRGHGHGYRDGNLDVDRDRHCQPYIS